MRIRRHADPDNQNVRINLTTAFQCSPYKLSILASDFRERFPGDDIDAGITMARLEKCGDRRTGDPGKYARRSLDYRNFLTGLRQSGRDFKPYIATTNDKRRTRCRRGCAKLTRIVRVTERENTFHAFDSRKLARCRPGGEDQPVE